ncbi:MAG: hypothetical protein PVF57_10640, partial [Pseudomonadales bacterium]
VFWLAVGLVGFLFGVELGGAWFADQSDWIITLAAVGLGVLGMVMAIVLERVAIALAGFYAAAYVALIVGRLSGHEVLPFFVPIAAGVVGAIATALLTDPAIIALTALFGSAAAASAMDLDPIPRALAFAALALLGSLAQYAVLVRRRRST